MGLPIGGLIAAGLGGTAVGIALGRAGRPLLVAGAARAIQLSRDLQALAEEARLSLDDIAAEARERAGEPPEHAPGEPHVIGGEGQRTG
jgi:hypothetical protein